MAGTQETTVSFQGITFKVADEIERAQALSLRAQIYREDLGHHGIDRFDTLAHHLIARDSEGELIAAVRIIGPELRPLEIEQFIDLSSLIGGRPAQIGGFWVRREHRQVIRDPFLQIGVLKLAYDFARKHAFTDFVMYTYSHLLAFYRSAYFEQKGLHFEHPTWGRVEVMHLDLVSLESQLVQSEQPLARLLSRTDLPNFMI